MKHFLKIVFFAFLVSVISFSCSTNKYEKIAKVGKYYININDFKSMLSPGTYNAFKKIGEQQQYAAGKNLIQQGLDHKALYILAKENNIKLVKDNKYNQAKEKWNKLRKAFYLKIGINEKELDRIFDEYYLQKAYLDKVKNEVQYTEKDLKDFYNTRKSLLFTIKSHINANMIRINIGGISVNEQNNVNDKINQIKNKVKENYDLFKTKLKIEFGDKVTFIEGKNFNINYLRILFKKSPDEYKNLLTQKPNSFSDTYNLGNDIILFYIITTQKNDIVQKYENVKDSVVKHYIEFKMQDLLQKKIEKYKATHKQEIFVENPFALIYK